MPTSQTKWMSLKVTCILYMCIHVERNGNGICKHMICNGGIKKMRANATRPQYSVEEEIHVTCFIKYVYLSRYIPVQGFQYIQLAYSV